METVKIDFGNQEAAELLKSDLYSAETIIMELEIAASSVQKRKELKEMLHYVSEAEVQKAIRETIKIFNLGKMVLKDFNE